MGAFDREILDYVDGFDSDICSLNDLLKYVVQFPDYDENRAVNDIQNLLGDGLLTFDNNSNTITLTDKAKSLPIPIPTNKNQRT